MIRSMRVLPALMIAGLAYIPAAPALVCRDECDEFDEAEVLVEINATDGDAGFQGIVDGEPWRRLKLRGTEGQKLFDFIVKNEAREQGLTEFVWESAEPTFDEVGLEEFLERFPEGEYTFRARTLEGGRLCSLAELTHHLPDGPVITAPEEDDAVDPDEDLVVMWNAVTTQFDLGGPGLGDPLEEPIVEYLVTVETDDDGPDKEIFIVAPPGSTQATIPADFLEPDREWKVEIGAVEDSGNRTFREVPFCTHEDECPEEEE